MVLPPMASRQTQSKGFFPQKVALLTSRTSSVGRNNETAGNRGSTVSGILAGPAQHRAEGGFHGAGYCHRRSRFSGNQSPCRRGSSVRSATLPVPACGTFSQFVRPTKSHACRSCRAHLRRANCRYSRWRPDHDRHRVNGCRSEIGVSTTAPAGRHQH